MYQRRFVFLGGMLCLMLLLLQFSMVPTTNACKDAIAVGDATAGEYNLLLKVRDPSRPGPQVLCIVNKGYEYEYHAPSFFTKQIHFKVEHKFIGVATQGDTLPNIVKPGMAISDAGIAYGDADSPSYWINFNRNAWDDFDWIRYACQQADTENEARRMMTKEVIDEMHAPAVAENLFVVGPNTAFIIEADAYRHNTREIKDIAVMSNYAKELWDTRLLKNVFVSQSFDAAKKEEIRRGQVIRLGSLQGIRVLEVGSDWIKVRQIPLGKKIIIKQGEGQPVGQYYVQLHDCYGKHAQVEICYKYYAWEQKIEDKLLAKYGSITVEDMMSLSRLHSEDINGLRAMCEGNDEASLICKIPYDHPEVLSCGWFAADQCSSIYVPVHICDTDIFDAYETSRAANQSLSLLTAYGHNTLTPAFMKTEAVFLNENNKVETAARHLLKEGRNIANAITASDTGMQQQAYLTKQIWYELHNKNQADVLKGAIAQIWKNNYSDTINNIKQMFPDIKDQKIENMLIRLSFTIGETAVTISEHIDEDQAKLVSEQIAKAKNRMDSGNLASGFSYIQTAINYYDTIVAGKTISVTPDGRKSPRSLIGYYAAIAIFILSLVLIIVVIINKFRPS